MSNSIRVLPPLLVNQIAAGECIERPASVVKELVENSLDAQAKSIEIHIEEAGVRLIKIVDDGIGIHKEDLPLALASHATSKITSADDLFSIATLGFRGEALASIASVSETQIASCPVGESSGYAITSKQGEHSVVKPTAMTQGTIIEVHDLFFNVPARRKFLKQRRVEMSYITDTVTKLALSCPGVSFRLMHNDRLVIAVDKTQSYKQRVEELLSTGNASLIEIQESHNKCKITAYIAPPEINRPNTKMQYLYINGRSVKDKVAFRALSDAFHDFLPAKRHPVGVIYIEIAPDEIDVNVHPTKAEVRFRDSSLIYSTIRNSVVKALSQTDIVPEIPLSSIAKSSTSVASSLPTSQEDIVAQKKQTTHEIATFGENAMPYTAPQVQENSTTTHKSFNDFIEHVPESLSIVESMPDHAPKKTITNVPQPPVSTVSPPNTPELFATTPDTRDLRYFQVHDSYLVLETENGIEIIDQHALHERIVFSKLRKQIHNAKVISQSLLFPITMSLTAKEMTVFQEWNSVLKKFGIEAESFGPNTIVIRSMPQLLGNVCEAELIHDILEQLQEHKEISFEKILEPVLATMACKASVKAGDKLNVEEVKSLIRRKEEADNPFHCPHGRPTTLKITLKELEKHFKRR